MSTLKNYRSIAVRNEYGKVISVMMVHKKVSDEKIENIFHEYTLEINKRVMDQIIVQLKKTGRACLEEVNLNRQHRLNILKKIVRMDDELNRTTTEHIAYVRGNLTDAKNWKSRDYTKFKRELQRNLDNSLYRRVIETEDEMEVYNGCLEFEREAITRELIYFCDVGDMDSVKSVDLFAVEEMEADD
jgi:hypothetical protein